MLRLATLLVVGALALSCGGPAGRPPQMGVGINAPEILLSDLDPQLHLRIFPSAGLTCDPGSGQVLRNGMRATDIPGMLPNPAIRCDATMWQTQMSMFGPQASPVDICFSTSGASVMQSVQVPAGDYIVLVEGSGAPTSGSGPHILLGSGCRQAVAMSGQTTSVMIDMVQQANTGVCGDMTVNANESCDPPDGMLCDTSCHFFEHVVSVTQGMGPALRPSLAWADSQQLLIGFDINDDIYLHQLDTMAEPITANAVLANDNLLDATPRSTQQQLRLAASPNGYAAAWQSLDRNNMVVSDFDIEGTFSSSYDMPPPPPTDVTINATSQMTGMGRANPSVAINGTNLAFVFEDQATGSVRVATASTSSFAAPTMDAALASGASAAMSRTPWIAASGSGFVATWAAGTLGSTNVYAVQLSAAGAPMGTPIQVNTTMGADQDQPQVAARGNDIVIVWRDRGHSALPNDAIRWRHFTGALMPDGMDRAAPASTMSGDESNPTVAIGTNSTVLIAWEAADGSIGGRVFNASGANVVNRLNGTPNDFVVNAAAGTMPSGTGPRHNPSAAFGGASLFAVGWEDAGDTRVHVRAFQPN